MRRLIIERVRKQRATIGALAASIAILVTSVALVAPGPPVVHRERIVAQQPLATPGPTPTFSETPGPQPTEVAPSASPSSVPSPTASLRPTEDFLTDDVIVIEQPLPPLVPPPPELLSGPRLAYTAGIGPGSGLRTVWLSTLDGRLRHRITNVSALGLHWSADGTRLTFAGDGASNSATTPEGIYVVDQDGRNLRRITERGSNPRWSPDGSMIAYDDGGNVRIVGSDGSPAHQLVFDPGYTARWSPDGAWLAIHTSTGIGIIRPDGSDARTLVAEDGMALSTDAWTPDGTAVLYERCDETPQLWLAPLDGSAPRLLADRPACGGYLSPDGRLIAYWGPQQRASIIGSDGADPLTLAPTCGDGAISWSPDSTHIAFGSHCVNVGDDPAHMGLWVVRSDGTGLRQLTGFGAEYPAFAPNW